ncbi:hypothetical protein P7K49_033728 [Saguinus oedipus]|uniref:Uncharacterized protein n=1 Tax=Saguinus oedipus TaxID=9490 RepID=A0ABQ9TSR6_SAGOE|nr:hypothetical protein P7K49_033728 [Saguinus oedipus]
MAARYVPDSSSAHLAPPLMAAPPRPDTSDVLQQIMVITDQSLDEAQARCCRRAWPGATQGRGSEGGGRRGRGGEARLTRGGPED